ncbi:type II toxin-antitoxin system PemK/MazF family toxin [Adlercreutzia sp. R21]|uniref:type II toxin-antitoxin system PemK/MazF family toxin n=1 Tax=Adlercreutzia wanghongyangiae TaxID=3111451 RepID=UPI002DBF065F|nr:type II toxin-antitoxin system PemK/MazF family toxin [Adlercreutzia sp. R21]MEC4183957.1 type II toxin-antitoxin system PemK/MazF family toxin [Adlercreutzia sp. R21]
MVAEQGDIVSLNFDPSRRHEPAGRHYAVVLSPWHVNRMSALTLLAPITSRDNGYPLHVPIAEGNDVHGFVQCEAIRAMDLNVREQENAAEIIGAIDDNTLAEVLACVLVVLGVEDI